MSYRTIIKAALTIAWRYPTLLVAGFLVALIIGWGASSALQQLGESLVTDLPTKIALGGVPLDSLVTSIVIALKTKPFQAILSILVPLIIILGLMVVAILAQGYLTLGTGAAAQGWFQRKTIWHKTKKRFPGLFTLALCGQLTSKGFLAIVTVVSLVFVGSRAPELGQIIFLISFFVLALPFGFFISTITKVGSVYLLVDDQSVGSSITSALRILHEHWLSVIEFLVLLVGLTITAGVVSVLAALLISTPPALVGIIAANTGARGTAHLFEAIAGALTVLVFLAGGTIISTILTNSWVVFTLTARDGGISSWLKRRLYKG